MIQLRKGPSLSMLGGFRDALIQQFCTASSSHLGVTHNQACHEVKGITASIEPLVKLRQLVLLP
jgi:hypothetical protein